MGIVVPEYLLEDIVDQMPQISYPNGNRSINFGYGDKKELNKYLQVKKEGSYPLIWLLMPQSELLTNEFSKSERDCNFIIATLEDRKDLYNSQRFRGSFDQFLLPVVNLLIEGISSAETTRFINQTQATINKFPNYSDESNSDSGGVIALWDAIRLDCRIEFQNACLKQIKWTTSTT